MHLATKFAAIFAAGALTCYAADARALLIDNDEARHDDPLELTHFYPYPTVYTYVDEGYAFDDDLLEAFVLEPYEMPIEERRSLVEQ